MLQNYLFFVQLPSLPPFLPPPPALPPSSFWQSVTIYTWVAWNILCRLGQFFTHNTWLASAPLILGLILPCLPSVGFVFACVEMPLLLFFIFFHIDSGNCILLCHFILLASFWCYDKPSRTKVTYRIMGLLWPILPEGGLSWWGRHGSEQLKQEAERSPQLQTWSRKGSGSRSRLQILKVCSDDALPLKVPILPPPPTDSTSLGPGVQMHEPVRGISHSSHDRNISVVFVGTSSNKLPQILLEI